MTHEDYMRVALAEADLAVRAGNAPFGVVVVDSETRQIIAQDHDRVKENCDPTAHAEINAIRNLCRQLDTTKLPHTIFYTTSEPCPTCLSVMIRTQVIQNFYGAETEEEASLPIKAIDLAKQATKHFIKVTGGIMAKECLDQRRGV